MALKFPYKFCIVFLLILRMGRFSPRLLYYDVVLVKKQTFKKSIVLEIHDTKLHQTILIVCADSPNVAKLSIMSFIPALGRLTQEGNECEANFSCGEWKELLFLK